METKTPFSRSDLVAGLFACAFVLWLCPSVKAARSWPDTSGRIVVFADQLPSTLSEAQRRFAATNLAGTQKLLRSEIEALRVYNTNFLCLHYQLGVGCGPHDFVVGEVWTNDWSFVTSHESWFLHNPSAQRVHQQDWNWDVMDITYAGVTPNTGFPQYWTTSCLARMVAADNDGVFADSFTVDAYGFGLSNPSHPWLEDVDACLANWIPNLEKFGRAVRTAFDADGRGFKFLPNLGGLVTSWDTMNYGLGHGGMIEGFALAGPDSYYAAEDWQLQINRALTLVRSNQIVLCQTYPGQFDYRERLLATASYLLIKGTRTYLNLLTSDAVALEYYPEYTVDLGGALASPAASANELWHAGWGVYRRDFSNGVVLVNPGETAVTIPNLGATYRRVSPQGGGTVGAAGTYSGRLNYQNVSSLTVPGYGGEILLNGAGQVVTNAPTVSRLAALHRAGQTFLTWSERSDLQGERYRVYRHNQPITTNTLAAAARLYEVPKGSATFYANRYMNDVGAWDYRYLERLVITNRGSPLPPDTGLLVWTLATNDFAGASSGVGYYAVTVVDADGTEYRTSLTSSNSIGTVAESVAEPLPVETAVNVGPGGHLYIQFMDLRNWNPTFHAPHERNGYYGLDPNDPALTSAVQYAYDYVVYEPAAAVAPAPAYLNLHGWAGNSYAPLTADPEVFDEGVYQIFPVDQSETWYFGFARQCDYRSGAVPASGDIVQNFTEQRILRMLYDLIRQPPGVPVDTNRLYAWGHSMGGSGVLALSLRYPNVFAACYASEPMTDYRHSGDGGGVDWRTDVDWKWGSMALNLPVVIRAPGNWASHLAGYAGRGVWDWQNHQANLTARIADEMVPFGLAHGTNDMVIEWPTQGRPLYGILNSARRCYGGAVTPDDHVWLSFQGLPPTLAPSDSLTPFHSFHVVRNETVPGLANASGNAALPPSGPGTYNLSLEWSSSWDPWDGPPLDTTNVWQLTLRSLNGSQTVDVTPRRTQRWPKTPGLQAAWSNTPIGASSPLQQGTVTADTHGLFLLAGVALSTNGNRLRLEINGSAPPSGHTFYVATNGDNTYPGTPSQPWRTPGFASRQLAPGDTLILRGGRYVLREFDADILAPGSGTPDAWITIKGEEGVRPILAARSNLYAAVVLSGRSNLRLENLEITHDAQVAGEAGHFRDGIVIMGEPPSTNIVLHTLYVHHLDQFGLNAQDVDHLTLTNCQFEYCGFGGVGGPAGTHGGWRNVTLRNCRLVYSGHYYQGGDGSSRPYDRPDGLGIEPSEGPVEILDTVAEHNFGDGLDSKAARTTIRRCIVANNSCDGVKLWDGGSRVENTLIYGRGDGDPSATPWAPVVFGRSAPTQTEFTFVNVTVDDLHGGSYLLYCNYDQPTEPLQVTLRNCIFRGVDSPIWINPASTLTADHNLFLNPGRPDQVLIHGAVTYSATTLSTLGSSNLYADPLFLKPAWGSTGNYHLQTNSPAINFGTLTGAPTDDLEGAQRGPRPDAGAYECVGCALADQVPATNNLVFIHHSSGENWLADGLHEALLAKSYIDQRNDITYGTVLSPDTNRPASLGAVAGDNTDMQHWILWFNDYFTRVRTHDSTSGFNQIILFKSCFPNSDIGADGVEPGDPFSADRTLANNRAIYRHPDGPSHSYRLDGYVYWPLEVIFATHPDTLFIPVTSPPLHFAPEDATTDPNAHRARLFNNWLKTDWLNAYNTAHPGLKNVAVYDWFDVLAYPDNHATHPNRLRAEYGGTNGDSHPNTVANSNSVWFFATAPTNFLDAVWARFPFSTGETAAAPRLLGVKWGTNGLSFRFSTQASHSYRVERTTRLGGAWETIGTVLGTGGEQSFIDALPPKAAAFYRVAW